MSPNTRRILLILGIALLLRALLPVASLLAVGSDKGFRFPDTGSYLRPAEEMLRTGRFTIGGEPEIRRTPGYPLLLVPGILLGSPVLVTIALQAALSLATVWLVYRTAQLLFGSADTAAAAALLYALEPLSILYTTVILAETLFTALIVASFFCLADYLKRRQSLLSVVLAAASLAASIYVRPVSYYLPFLVALVLAAALLLRHRKLAYLLHAAVFLAVSFGPLAAWQARNRAQTGYGGFSAITAVNLHHCQAASIRARLEGKSYQEVRWEDHPEQSSWSAVQRYEVWKREGIGLVMEHPVLYAGIHLKGMARILFDPGAMDYLKVLGAAPRARRHAGQDRGSGPGPGRARIAAGRPAGILDPARPVRPAGRLLSAGGARAAGPAVLRLLDQGGNRRGHPLLRDHFRRPAGLQPLPPCRDAVRLPVRRLRVGGPGRVAARPAHGAGGY